MTVSRVPAAVRSLPRGRRIGRLLAPAALPIWFGLSASGASAQGLGSATIFGDVRDESGRPVNAAFVELRHLPTGQVFQGITNAEGRYLLVNLRPGGPYELAARSTGFAPAERTDIRLEADERLRLDLTLSALAILLEGIDVSVDRQFNITRAGPAMNVNREEIRIRPSVDRNAMDLAVVAPLVIRTSEEGGLSISGQNERQNAVLIDGSLNQDIFGASPSGVPGAGARARPIPLDAIEEFRVDVAPFDARTSGFTGGVLNVITRSGTNEWERSAFSHFRNERMFGSMPVDGVEMAPDAYSNHVWGFTFGGPLRRDIAHLFVAAEFERLREPTSGYTLGVHDPIQVRVIPDSIARLTSILRDGYGVDAGSGGQLSLGNPLSNIFTRVDWQLGGRHTLTVRHNWAAAARDSTPNRAGHGPYELSSAGYRINASNHAFSVRLLSRVGAGHSNELTLNVQRSRERADPASLFPQTDVQLWSSLGENITVGRQVRAGARYFSQQNALDQDIAQLHESLTLNRDRILTTLGFGVDLFRFRWAYRPGSLGYYRFENLAELDANRPNHYEVSLPGPTGDGPIRFSVVQPSAYAQQEHRLGRGLTLRYGMRVDLPLFPGTPGFNEEVLEHFDLRTDQLPKVTPFFSPRFGFNWRSAWRWRTQLRGGAGIFTGQLPYVWMANAFQYDGLRSRMIVCDGTSAPAFEPSAPAPETCRGGASGQETASIVAFSRDFRYPRELKATVAFDQELPGDIIVSSELLWGFAFSRTVIRDRNLGPIRDPGDAGYDRTFGPRDHHGSPTGTGYRPDRLAPGFGPVVEIGWENEKARTVSGTIGARKRFSDWFRLEGSWTRSYSSDAQSLTHTDMIVNLASNPIGYVATDMLRRPSDFERPWKAVVQAAFRAPEHIGGAEISVVYIGHAGAPYSYVYAADINGDGFSGPGIPLDASNDLVFVPRIPGTIGAGITTSAFFTHFVNEVEPCLQDVRGRPTERNECRAPDLHSVDLRISQPIQVGRYRLDVVADLLNVLNLVNRDWGRVLGVDALVPLLDFDTRAEWGAGGPIPTSEALLGWAGSVTRDAEGRIRPALPHHPIMPASQWQAQIGVRVSF